MNLLEDGLTGLRTRHSFMPLLNRCVLASNDRRSPLALLVVDVDGFTRINNVYGYAAGDELLTHLARQLEAVARPQDYVARIGDNRFALILTHMLNPGHAELAIQKIQRLLDVPLQTRFARLQVHVTVGAAMCPQHASQPELLLRRAEAALAHARETGRKYATAQDAGDSLGLSDVWDLELQLAGAIERGEMELHYQPQARAGDLAIVGVEALMRWNPPGRGLVSPAVFIPIAERTEQISRLTTWALNTALRQAAEWKARRRMHVSVNLPGMLVTRPDLPELVQAALELWGSPGVQLTLEITESSLMDTDFAFQSLVRLRELGVRISIDDFGTGYSCLAYFRHMPADELKIDRSFVSTLREDAASADITRFIVQLAHRFGLGVAAEGVEDAETLALVRALGCETVQGYLIGRPMASATFARWLAEREASAPQ